MNCALIFWVRAFYWLTISNWNDEVKWRKKKQLVSLHFFFVFSNSIEIAQYTVVYIHIIKKNRENTVLPLEAIVKILIHQKVNVCTKNIFTMRYNYRFIVFVREKLKTFSWRLFSNTISQNVFRLFFIFGWIAVSRKFEGDTDLESTRCCMPYCGRFCAMCI